MPSSSPSRSTTAAWDTMYDKLVQFHQKHSHCRIPKSDRSLRKLSDWTVYQRCNNNALSQQQRAGLDELGFDWTTRDQNRESQWNKMFECLEVYKATNGDCLVTNSYCDDLNLYRWVIRQRAAKKTGKLPRHRRDRLRDIGFCWDASKASDDTSQSQRKDPAPAQGTVLAPAAAGGCQASWDVMYEKLARSYRTNGKCCISKSTSADLHNWILEQRVANASDDLSADKRLKLDLIKFNWMGKDEKNEEVWNKMFESFKAYKATNGDCWVPEAYQEDPKLFNWVIRQRHANKTKKLPRRRRDRLRGIGLCWDVSLKPKDTKQAPSLAVPATQPNPSARGTTSVSLPSSNSQQTHEDARSLMLQKKWDEMFERLQAYAAVNGDHFELYADDRQLHNWVDTQRYNHRQGILLQHRRGKLESIGFDWDARKPKISRPTEPRVTAVLAMKNHLPEVGQRWNLQLERLKIYEAWYGDFLVPTSYDKELAEWVSWQHYLHKINKLREPRYGKLERISFFSEAEAEKSVNGGTKRGASTCAALESEAQSIAGALDVPDGTDNADASKSGADLSRSPKRARVDGVSPSTGGANRD